MHPALTAALAAEHVSRLQEEAGRARLAALARCCRPSALRAAASALLARLARPAVACCA